MRSSHRRDGADRRAPARSAWALAIVAIAALVAGGCANDAADGEPPGVTLRITRDYGHELVSQERVALADGPTVLSALRHRHVVDAKLGGRVMRSIDGMRQRWGREGYESAWILTVNGLETEEPPASFRLHPGDLVQWDLRPWHVALDSRAMVGAFPELLARGFKGEPFEARLRCEPRPSPACRQARQALHGAGVAIAPAGPARHGAASERPAARVLVGAWRHWRHLEWPALLEAPTDYSGLYVRFAAGGARMRLLDWRGRIERVEGEGTGVLAVLSASPRDVTLLISGTDARGAARAARALGSGRVRGAFAAAVTADGVDKLPLPPESRRGPR